jgi:hypothetical protein
MTGTLILLASLTALAEFNVTLEFVAARNLVACSTLLAVWAMPENEMKSTAIINRDAVENSFWHITHLNRNTK